MFLFKEYEKAIEFKRANKGENKKIPEHNQADKKRNVETLNLATALNRCRTSKTIERT